MDLNRKSDLIGQLADSFNASQNNLNISTTNYITDTGSIDCTAMGLSLDTLEKTKRVIEQQESRLSNERNNPLSPQLLLHLKVAKKCVEEIISLKNKQQSMLPS